jgi:hypothetical protein
MISKEAEATEVMVLKSSTKTFLQENFKLIRKNSEGFEIPSYLA